MPKLMWLPAHPAVAQVIWESAGGEMGRKLAAHRELTALQGRDLKTAIGSKANPPEAGAMLCSA